MTVTAIALIRFMTNLEQLTGFLQSAAVRSFLVVMASAAVLSGCAANQQTASTANPQEEQDRALCLQHAHRDSGFNEKALKKIIRSAMLWLRRFLELVLLTTGSATTN